MNPRIPALALAAALLPGLALADEKTTVYKSKGASGETVYSQIELNGSEAHRVGINEPDAAPAKAEPATKTPEQVACQRAQANLAVLDSPQPVNFDRDGDGQMEIMTDDERTQNKEATQRQIEAFCESGAGG